MASRGDRFHLKDYSERIPSALRQWGRVARLRIVTAYSVIGFSRSDSIGVCATHESGTPSPVSYGSCTQGTRGCAGVPIDRSTNLRTAAAFCLVAGSGSSKLSIGGLLWITLFRIRSLRVDPTRLL